MDEDEEDDDTDKFFNDLFPDRERLDTVEEVTEPASSEYFQDSLPPDLDAAKMGSSGQPSSDFQNDSLPPDQVLMSSSGALLGYILASKLTQCSFSPFS